MRTLILILLVLVVAVYVSAQQPPAGVVAQGKAYAFTALDTVWSTADRDDETVAAAKWRGPVTYYYPKSNGTWGEREALPTAWYLYARKPFAMKAILQSGDSTGTVHTLVDTVSAERRGMMMELFPVEYILAAQISQLRVTPAGSDTVFAVPLVTK